MKKRVLNLHAGLGGNRKKWGRCSVVAVEKDERIANIYKRLYPDDLVIVGDAKEYLKENYENFDFIWASPSCQTHSRMVKATRHKSKPFPDMSLYQIIIFLDNFFKGNWIVENVVPYYKSLIEPAFKVGRHCFWSNRKLEGIEDVKRPSGFISKSNLKGKKEMQDWLGIHFDETIYIRGNHCPVQILRNCVHPDLGLQIYNRINQDGICRKCGGVPINSKGYGHAYSPPNEIGSRIVTHGQGGIVECLKCSNCGHSWK